MAACLNGSDRLKSRPALSARPKPLISLSQRRW